MTFRPKSNSKKEVFISLVTALAAIILFAMSGVVAKFTGLYQISAIVLAIVSLEIYMKYSASDYIYEAAEDALKIYKVTGKKSICLCSLDYEMSVSLVVNNADYENEKTKYPKSNFNVNYCKNIAPLAFCVYFFEFNNKISMMKFEPDALFCEYVNEKIKCSLENAENEYDEE